MYLIQYSINTTKSQGDILEIRVKNKLDIIPTLKDVIPPEIWEDIMWSEEYYKKYNEYPDCSYYIAVHGYCEANDFR